MKELFKTRDFYLSAVLIAQGCKLLYLEKSNGNFSTFVFEDSPEDCKRIISSYWEDSLSINPKSLISAINQLKTRLHERV